MIDANTDAVHRSMTALTCGDGAVIRKERVLLQLLPATMPPSHEEPIEPTLTSSPVAPALTATAPSRAALKHRTRPTHRQRRRD